MNQDSRFFLDVTVQVPAFVVMFEQPDPDADALKEGETKKNVQFGMAQYSIAQMGAIQYGNVGSWLQNVVGQVKPEGLPSEEGDDNNYGGGGGGGGGGGKDEGPLVEMTESTFDTVCPMKNALCTIVLVDGSDVEGTRQGTSLVYMLVVLVGYLPVPTTR